MEGKKGRGGREAEGSEGGSKGYWRDSGVMGRGGE